MDKAVAADESLGTDERDTCCAREDTGDKKLFEADETNESWAVCKLEGSDISGIISPSLNFDDRHKSLCLLVLGCGLVGEVVKLAGAVYIFTNIYLKFYCYEWVM